MPNTQPLRENLTEAGYTDAVPLGDGEYLLTSTCGAQEVWFASPHHASYGVVLDDGTELEFARSRREETNHAL